MKLIPITGVALSVVAAGILVVALKQRAQLAKVRMEETTAMAGVPGSDKGEASAHSKGPTDALTEAEHDELLRLRGQLRPLMDQVAALPSLTNRNLLLKARRNAARKANEPFPADFIRKSEAKNAGNGTPEASLETFLWAVQHQDTNVLLGIVGGGFAEMMRNQFAQGIPTNFFRELGALPGMRILGRTNVTADSMELNFETVPGTSLSFKFTRQTNGWVLDP
jgi:hypothetical protein